MKRLQKRHSKSLHPSYWQPYSSVFFCPDVYTLTNEYI